MKRERIGPRCQPSKEESRRIPVGENQSGGRTRNQKPEIRNQKLKILLVSYGTYQWTTGAPMRLARKAKVLELNLPAPLLLSCTPPSGPARPPLDRLGAPGLSVLLRSLCSFLVLSDFGFSFSFCFCFCPSPGHARSRRPRPAISPSLHSAAAIRARADSSPSGSRRSCWQTAGWQTAARPWRCC